MLFKFGNPEYLYLLIIIPIMIIGYIFIRFDRKRKLAKFGEPELMAKLMPEVSVSRQIIKFIILVLALICIIIAIARPQFGSKLETVKRNGVEVIIALDISNSMMAEDISPNRLEKSKQIIYKLLDIMNNDKLGLIVFAGRSFIQLPITNDYQTSKMLISTVEPKLIVEQGTDIKSAIELASRSFTSQENLGKSIIVITDGEDHEQEAVNAAKAAAEKGIQVNVIGIGTPQGGLIPSSNGYKKDKAGNFVTSKLNEKMGQAIALAGNGIYVRATNTNNDIKIIQDEIKKIAKGDVEDKAYSDYNEEFPLFCWIALFLLVIEIFLLEKKNMFFRNFKLFE